MTITSTALLLVTAHFFGDFVFQTEYIAREKVKRLYILLVHSWIYTFSIYCVLLFTEFPTWKLPWICFFILATHILMDSRILLRSFTKEASFMGDQIFHLIVLGIVLMGYNF